MSSVPTALVIDARIAELARDKKSLELRCAALTRALTGRVPATYVATVGAAAALEPMLTIARLFEQEGRVPVVRFARGADGTITGIELAVVRTLEECKASETPPTDGMSVLADQPSEFIAAEAQR